MTLNASSISALAPHLTHDAFRVAVIGSGVSGLAAAYRLNTLAAQSGGALGLQPAQTLQVSLIEADGRFGGHAHTVQVQPPGQSPFGIDTGFLVYNERTYPGLITLLSELGVVTAQSDMSFSVQSSQSIGQKNLIWCGSSINSVFAQRSNIVSLRFWRMLLDITRFNRLLTAMALQDEANGVSQGVGEYLAQNHFGEGFVQDYLLPMIASIWSCPTGQMMAFPVQTLARFCHNHGLLQIINRPQWFTVAGGSKNYVQKIIDTLPDKRLNASVLSVRRHDSGVWVQTAQGEEYFDAVVLATHSDQALRLLGDGATTQEREILGSIQYQQNHAVLHTDVSVMPRLRRAWAAWNYERSAASEHGEASRVCLHYWLNILQPLPTKTPYFVSLNPIREIDSAKIVQQIEYAHPVFDAKAIEAQKQLHRIQGDGEHVKGRIWYAGAWCKYGFHEDGLQSGLRTAQAVWDCFVRQNNS